MITPTSDENRTRSMQAGRSLRPHPLANQNGSMIVLVLMVLAIMSVIAIVSSDAVVTENFIIRNVGIHKQNAHLVDSALMEGLQAFLQIPNDDPDNFDPGGSIWINSRNDAWTTGNVNGWYETDFTGRRLVGANSIDAAAMPLLAVRGEAANGNLRYALVGWQPVQYGPAGSESLKVSGQPTWRAGRLLAEYVSSDGGGNDNGFGLLRMEIGVRQAW